MEVVINQKVYLNITPDYPSNYDELLQDGSAIFYLSLIGELVSQVTLIIACYTLSGFIVNRKFNFSVPVCVLLLEIMASLLRIVLFIDPILTEGIYPFRANYMVTILPTPFTLAGSTLLAFFFEETIRSSRVASIPSLDKLKIPATIFISIIFTSEFTSGLLRVFFAPVPYLATVSDVVDASTTLSVGLFFMLAGYRVLSIIRRGQKNQPGTSMERRRNLHRITKLIIGAGFSMISYFIFCLVYISFLSSQISVEKNYFILGLQDLSQMFCSLFSVLVFQRPIKESASTPIGEIDNNSSNNLETVLVAPEISK